MKISIRWAVILSCLGLVWATQLLVTPISYFSNRKVMLRHTRDIMENICDLTLEETLNFLSIAGGAANLTKRLISSSVINIETQGRESLERYFIEQLEIYPQFSGIYFARPDGSFYFVHRDGDGYKTKIIDCTGPKRTVNLTRRDRDMTLLKQWTTPEDAYDPRVRPWYIKAVRQNEIIWTDPYVFFTSHKPGITAAGPITAPDGSLAGVVGVDIELDALSNFIGKLRVGKTGLAFMVNQNRDVIAYPDLEQLKYEKPDEKIRLPKVTELDNKLCSMAYEAVKSELQQTGGHGKGQVVFASFEFENQTYFTMFAPVHEKRISWLIGVYIPKKDYFSEIIANQHLTLFLTLSFSILATILGLFMAGKFIRPISQLHEEAEKIKNHDYASLPRIRSAFHQIQRTADTFYEMKQSIIAFKQELEQKERFNRAITDTAREAIVMVGDDEKVYYWNAAAQQLFGYDAREVAQKNIFDLVPFRKHQDSDHSSLYALFKKREIPGENIELNIIRKDGETIAAELSMVDIQVEDKPYLISVIRDISARKALEQEKMDILEQLQHAQKMESIGTLAGGIAHDFNNILSSMVGYTDLLRESGGLNKEGLKYLESITAAGDRASDLVRQILTFSFQESGQFKPLKIQDIVLEACHLIKVSLPPSIVIRQDIDMACGPILADATQIHQVALNLMTNAFQAMEETGGTLGISLKQVNITEDPGPENKDLKPGTYLCYSVSDTGVGMDGHVMEKIFDPYFTTKTRGKNTGLGLAVIKGIVQHHGGDIRVESRPEIGTTFKVYFPVVKPSPGEAPTTRPIKIKKGNEQILLVDDQPNVLFVERQILELLGYQVTARASAGEAIETFKGSPKRFDMVVTDYSMPGMTGDVLARELVRIRPDIPVILCTGYSEGAGLDRDKDQAVRAFVMKPVKLKDFAVIIRKILDNE